MTLGTCVFVRHETVQVGSCTFDHPSPAHPRFLRLRDLHPIVYSEAVANPLAITDSATEPEEA